MAVYYLYDDSLRQKLNEEGKNFWFLYITEICSRLGVSALPLHNSELADVKFEPTDTLIVGACTLSATEAKGLNSAAKRGCTLVAFAACGCDELFGINNCGEIPQTVCDFELNGYFNLNDTFVDNLLPVGNGDSPLPVFSDIIRLKTGNAEIAGLISLPNGECVPGLMIYKTQYTTSYYFAFDLPKTLWTSAAGKPVNSGSAHFPVGRIPDSRITPIEYDTSIAFGDYYVYILQSILANKGEPMIHRLPPDGDKIPDYLIYIGGDDDAASDELDLTASLIMYEKNLPYHINLMQDADGEFVINGNQYRLIKSRGHELALHYNFVGRDFTQAAFKEQIKKYVESFGDIPVCNVGHCLIHMGWAERCRYQEALGVLGDNGKLGEIDPDNINAFNLHGFGFGTAFPFFARDDYKHGNRLMKFLELPISYYEPRLPKNDTSAAEKLHQCADQSAFFGRTLNLFVHPHYISGMHDDVPSDMPTPAILAVEEILSYSSGKGYNVILWGPDKLCKWWHDRALSTVAPISSDEKQKLYRVENCCKDGIVIKLPYSAKVKEVTVNGVSAEPVNKTIDGHKWLLIAIDSIGTHEVAVYS